MADYFWTGALDTVASNPGNWVDSGGVVHTSPPGASDSLIIDPALATISNPICELNIVTITNITHNYAGVTLVFGATGITSHTITGKFELGGEVGVSTSTTGVVKVSFTGVGKGSGDIVYQPMANASFVTPSGTIHTTLPYRSETLSKLYFYFNTTNPVVLPAGPYPIVELTQDVSPHYNTEESAHTAFGEVDIYKLITTTTGSFIEINAGVYSSNPLKEKNKKFRVRELVMADRKFEGGKAEWIFHAGGANTNFELPLTGTGRQTYGSGIINKFDKITVVRDHNSGNNQQGIPPGNHYLKSLSVAEGVMLRSMRGMCELHIASRPNIRGGWQFYAITDGIYRSKKQSMIEPLESGGTNTSIYTANAVPFVNDAGVGTAFLDMGQGATFHYNHATQTLTVPFIVGDGSGLLNVPGGGGGGGGMTSFTLTADSGSNQTIEDTNTLDIEGGTGISTVVGATDKVTINNDGVTSAAAGPGITVSAATGGVTIENVGVTEAINGRNIGVSAPAGPVEIHANFPEHGIGMPPLPQFAQTPDDLTLGYMPYGWVEMVTITGVTVVVPAWIQS
tara:strand:- start:1183 stop:2880 length:1698 start_codon:yes stop_codon:yes gene_type:complete